LINRRFSSVMVLAPLPRLALMDQKITPALVFHVKRGQVVSVLAFLFFRVEYFEQRNLAFIRTLNWGSTWPRCTIDSVSLLKLQNATISFTHSWMLTNGR